MTARIPRLTCIGMFVSLLTTVLPAAELEFELRFKSTVRREPFTGRVYVFSTAHPEREPRMGPNWFKPEPFVSVEVRDWQPDTPLRIAADTPGLRSFPKPFAEFPRTGRVQGIARFNPWEREVGTGAGNGMSKPVAIPENPAGPIVLELDALVPPRVFADTMWSKRFAVPSPLLSKFYGRPVELQGAVILPQSYYAEPERRYPVIFTIPGFGGTHHDGRRDQPIAEKNEEGVEFLRVVLDPSCPLGHHVFADSANNGPVGTAFTTEFLPAFDRAYRTDARPAARFLTGHSSGGWSSLWLQVTYPELFGGVWSTAPDPVDFRDYQQANLYDPPENMYRETDGGDATLDPNGDRRPIARRGKEPVLWYDDFAAMEETLGPGGQLLSFEAVFSPRLPDGTPRLMFNRQTGDIDADTVKAWEAYDIRLVLERNWKERGPKLAGKIHILMGDLDTFYLEGAVRKLKESLTTLGSDASIELVPGKDHFNLLTPETTQRMRAEMVRQYLKHRR